MDLYSLLKDQIGGQWPTYKCIRETGGLPHGSRSQLWISFESDWPNGSTRYVQIGRGTVGQWIWKEGSGELSQDEIYFRVLALLRHVGLFITNVNQVYGLTDEQLVDFSRAIKRIEREIYRR